MAAMSTPSLCIFNFISLLGCKRKHISKCSNQNLFVLSSVKEEVFWRNYFYRVSLIKQSAQLTALAAQQQAVGKEENKGREEDIQLKGMGRICLAQLVKLVMHADCIHQVISNFYP